MPEAVVACPQADAVPCITSLLSSLIIHLLLLLLTYTPLDRPAVPYVPYCRVAGYHQFEICWKSRVYTQLTRGV